ncbi:PEP-CTERM sorting domain-containing protein [Neptunomonas antarctica]|uniref:PEP-CTERM protein-sorting domain-containing protein n=1 Tax=Neptunomonas antarctica TaxID=619304 RepID=A0A1N7IZD3_9GAMM|nr:PEP-CTERM sorting domain-containing protein [Neptunomonas antarctica]SIS42465.1 PEP-CTERM protein-sorting domain-containing protein [Neptunomonas antarctica]
MKFKMLKGAIAGVALSVSCFANAGLLTVSEITNQTTDGQLFNFSLNISDYLAGSSSTLEVITQGDFNNGANSSESIDVSIDGVSFGNFGFDSAEAYNVVSYNYNAYKFNLNFLLDAATTTSILLDDMLNVVIDFGGGVNPNCGWSSTSSCNINSGVSPFAAINYTYSNSAKTLTSTTNVPEPSTLAIFALGLMGLASRRLKKKS